IFSPECAICDVCWHRVSQAVFLACAPCAIAVAVALRRKSRSEPRRGFVPTRQPGSSSGRSQARLQFQRPGCEIVQILLRLLPSLTLAYVFLRLLCEMTKRHYQFCHAFALWA